MRSPLQLRRTAGVKPNGTEELVYTRAGDGIVSGGALFRPRDQSSATHVAAIWIHGSGVNFYYPSYVKIARELAKRGLPTIVGNTRMHDLGNIEAFREPTNARGGSYWGITTAQVSDVAAWIQLARDRGYDRVVLVGHSAGATAVQIYMARTQDPHVEGLVLASGRFRPASGLHARRFSAARACEGARCCRPWRGACPADSRRRASVSDERGDPRRSGRDGCGNVRLLWRHHSRSADRAGPRADPRLVRHERRRGHVGRPRAIGEDPEESRGRPEPREHGHDSRGVTHVRRARSCDRGNARQLGSGNTPSTIDGAVVNDEKPWAVASWVLNENTPCRKPLKTQGKVVAGANSRSRAPPNSIPSGQRSRRRLLLLSQRHDGVHVGCPASWSPRSNQRRDGQTGRRHRGGGQVGRGGFVEHGPQDVTRGKCTDESGDAGEPHQPQGIPAARPDRRCQTGSRRAPCGAQSHVVR